MTTNLHPADIITTTAELRASFALPSNVLPFNVHATNAEYDRSRSALNALDSALNTLLSQMPLDTPGLDLIDYLEDDFHDDPFFFLNIDPNGNDDVPITVEAIIQLIANEIDDAMTP